MNLEAPFGLVIKLTFGLLLEMCYCLFRDSVALVKHILFRITDLISSANISIVHLVTKKG